MVKRGAYAEQTPGSCQRCLGDGFLPGIPKAMNPFAYSLPYLQCGASFDHIYYVIHSSRLLEGGRLKHEDAAAQTDAIVYRTRLGRGRNRDPAEFSALTGVARCEP